MAYQRLLCALNCVNGNAESTKKKILYCCFNYWKQFRVLGQTRIEVIAV
jgi:hypothetical protein